MSDSWRLPNLPHTPGVYLMRDNKAAIVYIGKARDLKKRVSSYFRKRSKVSSLDQYSDAAKVQALLTVIRHIDYVPTASEREALVLERKLINQFKPDFNVMWKDDKSYPYVGLTMGEDFPRVILTRHRKKDGSLYFGPYPSVTGVRQLLRWAWRKKLFPLRPCRFEIEEGRPLPYQKVKSCLYLHTGECPAPCLGKIDSKSYGKIAERARWFFEGKKEKLINQWEKEMTRKSRRLEFEEAASLRNHIETVRHMNEHVTVRVMTEDILNTRIQKSRAVQELMTELKMKSPPEIIECFDISHIQGVEKVASMVRFLNGRPDKSNYRKYIIKSVEGIDDFKSMAEVVGRRYRRLKQEGSPFPDLILIDGGKGQLSSALKALEDEKLKGMFVAALAKEEEEVFLPGSSNSLRLPPDSAALLLLRQVRDEAHRFAITFHRQRRNKKTFYDENDKST